MEKKFSNKPGIRICFVMVFSFVLSFALNIPVHADEEPEKIYYGLKNASTILNNIILPMSETLQHGQRRQFARLRLWILLKATATGCLGAQTM